MGRVDELDHFLAELRENLNCFTGRGNRNCINVSFVEDSSKETDKISRK